MSELQNGINANASTPLEALQGGTGLSSPTAHSILIGEGASPLTPIVLTAGQVLIGTTAGDPVGATLTQGSGVTITSASGVITIAASTSLTLTTVNHAASPYTVLTADSFLACDPTAGTISIVLPNAPSTGRIIYIKDSTGLAATSNITITTVGGSVTIDGVTSYVLNNNYQSVSLVFDGTGYEVY